MPLSIAKPVILPSWWSECAPIGQILYGVKDTSGDPAFKPDGNEWGNEFVDQILLMRLANGGVARITEARGYGWAARPGSYISGFYGTKAGYEFSNAQHIFAVKDPSCMNKERAILTDVSDYVNPADMVANKDLPDFKQQVANGAWQNDSKAAIQKKEYERIPKEFEGLENGHMASHQLMVDDFCKAVLSGEIPALNAWFAARTNIPGLVAIESAKQGGITLPVPDCGPAPQK